jgi:hypothetical protein
MNDHQLTVTSLKPLNASCSCGKWTLEDDDERDEGRAKDWVNYCYRLHLEKVNQNNKIEKFHTLAQQIAANLEGWTYEGRDLDDSNDWKNHFAYLKHTSGACVSLNLHCRENRINVGGEYFDKNGSSFPYRDKRADTITISPDREPRTLAKDILRRFIPAYLEAYALGQQQYENHVKYVNAKEALVSKFIAICGKDKRRNDTIHVYKQDGGYFDLTVDGEDSVRLDLRSVPAAKALKIVKLMMEK